MTAKTKPPTDSEITAMTKQIMQGPKPAARTAEQAALEIAAARAEGYAAARAQGFAEGARIETARCEAIICSQEAKGREALALHVACNLRMSVEDALATLRLSPEAAPAPKPDGDSGFLAAMGYGRKP